MEKCVCSENSDQRTDASAKIERIAVHELPRTIDFIETFSRSNFFMADFNDRRQFTAEVREFS
jgi:hypothetical protein